MKITAILANHAETAEGRLYLSGGGFSVVPFPPGTQAPWQISLGLAIIVNVDWNETNQQRTMVLDLVDEDDQPVPLGDGSASMHAELPFNVGRAAGAFEGDEQTIIFALNFAALPLAKLGKFNFRIQVAGEVVERVPFRALVQQQAQFGSVAG